MNDEAELWQLRARVLQHIHGRVVQKAQGGFGPPVSTAKEHTSVMAVTGLHWLAQE
jgi:hypothetical protein